MVKPTPTQSSKLFLRNLTLLFFALLLLTIANLLTFRIGQKSTSSSASTSTTSVTAQEICNKREHFTRVKQCPAFWVGITRCCDFPDYIYDLSGNQIDICGGLTGYSSDCRNKYFPQTNCQDIQCSSTTPTPAYSCPSNGWVNCMPILTPEAQKGCTPEAVNWYKSHCPNFQGIAE